MANSTKPVVIRYRRLSEMPFRRAASSLQEAVAEAMQISVGGVKLKDDYELRECNSLFQSSDTYVLAYPEINDNFFFCELARFEKGANIPLCWGSERNPGALVLGQQKPGEGREALLGVMQFMIIGNHVIMIESASVRTARLEQYITWLLKDVAKFIPQESHLILDTEFQMSSADGAKLSNVKEISLRPIGLKQTEGSADVSGYEHIERREARDSAPPTIARQILGLLGNSEADIDKLLHDVPPGGDLELRLSLFFKKGRQKGAVNPSMASARRLLRNMEDDAIELKGPEGRVIGTLMAISREARVMVDGAIISYTDAARLLWETYEQWLATSRIEDGV